MQLLNQWRDKAREVLHGFSHWMGETASIKPESLYDGAMAQDSLCMDLPSFRSVLPYEAMDEDQLFVNRESAGFGLHLMPSSGADESLMLSLAELFKNKLPVDVDCTVLLYKHHYLASQLAQSYVPILNKGGIYAELARMSLDFHLKATKEGYKNGRNVPAQLVDYSAYVFISMRINTDCQRKLKLLRDDWESGLKVAGFSHCRLNENNFKTLLRTLVSPSINANEWPTVAAGEGFISEFIPHPSTVYEISDRSIDISHSDDEGIPQVVRVVNCEISKWPNPDEEFALWQTPDLFANLLRPEHGIQCPFLLSFTVRGVSREKTRRTTKQRTRSSTSNNNAIQNFLNPRLADEAAEWQLVHKEMSKDNLDLLPSFYNLVLFTTQEKEREHVAKAVSSYRQMGFTLTQSRCKQWLRFLSSLPFLMTEGLFSRLQYLGLTKKLSHYNVANLLPVIADFKGCTQGLLLPTYRHQLFFYDPFDDKNLPISNYNRLTVASTGAGKSYLQQALLLDGLSRGHQIFVIDLGESYKHVCQMVGGTYVDATTITLNPFTLFDFEGVTEVGGEQVSNYIQIRDLLAIMASPEQGLDEVQRDWLLDAILMCWRIYGRKSNIDGVLDALKEILQKPESRNDRRLKDLLILLSKYGRDGLYGTMFHGETPLFNQSQFTVFELGGFESNPQLLTIVMYVMIVIIQGQFYNSDRRLKKQCNFDEVWRAISSNSNPIAAGFLEQGYRTARKYNAGFSAVTQHLSDTDATLQGQAIAACSDTKFIMRQGSFKDYIEKHPKHFNPLQQKVIESFGEAKMQGFSNLMIQYGNVYTFHRYFSDPFSKVLFSTSGDEFGEIEAQTAAGVPLSEAISRVAHKYYGEELCD